MIFLIIDSFKVLVLFPLHIRSSYLEYASYVTDKRNTIHISIQTQRIKLKEGSVFRVIKIYLKELKIKNEI